MTDHTPDDPEQMQPTRWWRAVDDQGGLWAESSDPDEIRARMRPGDHLERLYEVVSVESEWRPIDA